VKAKILYKKKPKRIGRGSGSGHGKTSTRGSKGQLSRSGAKHRQGFEGGQMPFIRRIPKRGFTPPFKKNFAVVNLDRLSSVREAVITPDLLMKKGLVRKLRDGLKILGNGEIKRSITVEAHRFSESAKLKIEKAGGKVVVISRKKSPAPQENKQAKQGSKQKPQSKKKNFNRKKGR